MNNNYKILYVVKIKSDFSYTTTMIFADKNTILFAFNIDILANNIVKSVIILLLE